MHAVVVAQLGGGGRGDAAAVDSASCRAHRRLTREAGHGIGGSFFRAHDPEALARWYSDRLGVDLTPSDYEQTSWQQAAGATVFEPFDFDTTHFGAANSPWMLNFPRPSSEHCLSGESEACDGQTEPTGTMTVVPVVEGGGRVGFEASGVSPGAFFRP